MRSSPLPAVRFGVVAFACLALLLQVVGLVLVAVNRAIRADAILTALIGVAAAALVVTGIRWLAGRDGRT